MRDFFEDNAWLIRIIIGVVMIAFIVVSLLTIKTQNEKIEALNAAVSEANKSMVFLSIFSKSTCAGSAQNCSLHTSSNTSVSFSASR